MPKATELESERAGICFLGPSFQALALFVSRTSTNVYHGLFFFLPTLVCWQLKKWNSTYLIGFTSLLKLYVEYFCLFFRLISYLSNHGQSLSGFGKVGLRAWQNKGKRNSSIVTSVIQKEVRRCKDFRLETLRRWEPKVNYLSQSASTEERGPRLSNQELTCKI